MLSCGGFLPPPGYPSQHVVVWGFPSSPGYPSQHVTEKKVLRGFMVLPVFATFTEIFEKRSRYSYICSLYIERTHSIGIFIGLGLLLGRYERGVVHREYILFLNREKKNRRPPEIVALPKEKKPIFVYLQHFVLKELFGFFTVVDLRSGSTNKG